jgi:hypothetical protein
MLTLDCGKEASNERVQTEERVEMRIQRRTLAPELFGEFSVAGISDQTAESEQGNDREDSKWKMHRGVTAVIVPKRTLHNMHTIISRGA